jgi:uncharacterized OsmC-like protein
MSHTKAMEKTITNGIDVAEFEKVVEAVRKQPDLSKFRFRAKNTWDTGGHNRTTIKEFYGAGEEHGTQSRKFTVDADEPPILLGKDSAPSPVEVLLHALGSCLTTSLAYQAALRGIPVESIESTLEGDIDVTKFLGLPSERRTGFSEIRATLKVKSNARPEQIKELAEMSPVLDVVSHGTTVNLRVERQ